MIVIPLPGQWRQTSYQEFKVNWNVNKENSPKEKKKENEKVEEKEFKAILSYTWSSRLPKLHASTGQNTDMQMFHRADICHQLDKLPLHKKKFFLKTLEKQFWFLKTQNTIRYNSRALCDSSNRNLGFGECTPSWM